MPSLIDLTFLTLLCAALGLWWRAQHIRELALAATRRALRAQDLSLLDDNVALRSLWFRRDRNGRLRLWRRYNFEFTVSGHERYQGFTITLGNVVENIHLPPHRIPEQQRLH